MNTLKKIVLLPFFALFLITSCDKEETPIDPKRDILGKWELIQDGTSLENLRDRPPSGYTEYLDDTSYRFHDYETGEFTYGDYSLDDSMLIHYYYAVGNDQAVDTIPIRYFYTFANKRHLILDIDANAILRVFIYRKIK